MLDKIRQYLTDLDFPSIAAFNDDDVVNLFVGENLPNFFRWFVGVLLDSPDEASAYRNEEIVDILRNFGFCCEEDKEDLLTGALSFDKQYEVINKMLYNMSVIRKAELANAEPSKEITLDELNAFLSAKIDLLPAFSGKKAYNDHEREEHASRMTAQIRELEERANLLEQQLANKLGIPEEKDVQKSTIAVLNKGEQETIPNLAPTINQFLFSTSNLSEISDNIKQTSGKKCVGMFSDQFSMKLRECCDAMSDLEQYFKNLSILEEHNASQRHVPSSVQSESVVLVEDLLKLVETL